MHKERFPTQPKIKKDWPEVYRERVSKFCDIIERHGSIGEAQMKMNFGEGPGVYKETKSTALQLHSEFIKWNSRTKLFSFIKPELEKQVIEANWEGEL